MSHVCVVRQNPLDIDQWVAACSCGWVSEPGSMTGAGNAKSAHEKTQREKEAR